MRRKPDSRWPAPPAIAVAALLVVALLAPAAPASDGAAGEGCAHAPVPCRDLRIGGDLPLPCSLPLADYEQVLYRWMNERRYAELGWEKDERIRDTGPFVLGSNYGTDPSVRIYYSPEASRWLRAGRPQDGLPVASMIVKEMFNLPAARYEKSVTAAAFDGEILQQFMAATEPEGIGGDPDYTRDRTGRDRVRYAITLPQGTDATQATVRVTLNYQAFQPYWLKRKFELSGDDPATQRLYYLASRLNTAGTVIDDWKLPLVTCTKTASGTSSGCAERGAS